MSDYDVVVVGAGLGGLSCAARLSQLGYSVCVIDKHSCVGGYASAFVRGDYRFDASLHGIGSLNPGSEFQNILSACGVFERIIPIRKDHPYSVLAQGNIIDIPQDVKTYEDMLCQLYPDEVDGIRKLFDALRRFKKELSFLYSDAISPWQKAILFPVRCPLLFKWSRLTTEEVCREYIASSSLMNLLTIQWTYFGLPPRQLSALYFFIPWVGFHLDGTYYIQGGGQAISNAFADTIQENKGTILLKTPVRKILHDGRLATSVLLKDGREISADWVVSNASPLMTMTELIQYDTPKTKRFTKSLGKMEVGASILQLFVGLDCPPEAIGCTNADLHIWDECDHTHDYEYSKAANYEKANLLFTNYSVLDASASPDGKGILAITCLDDISNWPERGVEYKQKKKDVIKLLLRRADNYFPDIREHVVVAELATPRTMHRYTWNPRGAVYGFAQTVAQSGIRRLGPRSPFSRLSFVGAWTRPGGGYQGTIISGFQEANRIHRKLR